MKRTEPVHVAVAETSVIVRSGLVAVLKRMPDLQQKLHLKYLFLLLYQIISPLEQSARRADMGKFKDRYIGKKRKNCMIEKHSQVFAAP